MCYLPKISVIIPVYNTAKFLRQCLDSVVTQTLHDIEIICIDDGSTDASLDILNEYAANDSRITILTQQNKGAGAARNAGMRAAHGEYIHFLDSDDMISPGAYKVLYETASAEKLDVLQFNCKAFFESKETEKNFSSHAEPFSHPHNDIPCMNGEDFFVYQQKDHIDFSAVCMAIYRFSHLKSISLTFIEGIIHEDNSFPFICILKAQRVAFISAKLYLYRIRAGSTMTTPDPYRHLHGYLVSYYNMSNFALTETFKPETLAYIAQKLDGIKYQIYILYGKSSNTDVHYNECEMSLLQPLIYAAQHKRRIQIIALVPRKAKKFMQICRESGIRYALKLVINRHCN